MMGCQYSQFDETCSLYDPEIENPGCTDEGYCVCEDDENPLYLCEKYKSDEE